MNSSWTTTTSGSSTTVQCHRCSSTKRMSKSAPTPKNLSTNDVIALVNGSSSSGKTTFCTSPELPLMLFMPLFRDSENARNGRRPQYRKRPKFSVGSPSTTLNLIPIILEKIKERKKTHTKGPKNAHAKP